jgi:hypothetical protein
VTLFVAFFLVRVAATGGVPVLLLLLLLLPMLER